MKSVVGQAVRRLTRRPAFTTIAVLVLALGIGVATAMLSLVQATLLRLPPWPESSRLVVVHAVRPDQRSLPAFATTWNRAPISWASWRDLEKSTAFASIGVWMSSQQILGDSRAEIVTVHYVSSSFLPVLGVSPPLGRSFTPAEDTEVTDLAVISYELWQRDFGGQPDVVGQTVALTYTYSSQTMRKRIVGILPPGFQFQGESPSVLLPIGLMAFNGSFETNRFLRAVARLAPRVSIDQAAAAAEPLVRRLEPAGERTARIATLAEDRFGNLARPLWLLLGGAGLLLAVGCSTLTGLLLVDGHARRDEMAVRAALGASRFALYRQLGFEYGLLALVGSAAGVLLAHWLVPVAIAMAPASIRVLDSVSVDSTVAAWALCVGITTVLVFGVSPAAAVSVPARSTVSRTAGSARGHRSIVAAQIAVAFVLISSAGLFSHTLLALQSKPLGFEPSGLAVATVKLKWEPVVLPPANGPAQESRPTDGRAGLEATRNSGWLHTQGILKRLAALPSVEATAGTSLAPFTRPAPVTRIREAGTAYGEHELQWQAVTEDYFHVMGIPIVRGRGLLSADRNVTPSRIVVSVGEERRLTNQEAVGTELDWAGYPHEIVGVAGRVQQHRVWAGRPALPTMYLINLRASQTNHLLVRTTQDARHLLPLVKATIEEYDSSLQVTEMAAMSDLVAESMAEERFMGMLSMAFGATALVLTAVGLFGLTSYRLAMRRVEFAVRTALGADAGDVRRLVLRDAAVVVLIGIAAGVPGVYAAFHVFQALLFEVTTIPGTVWLVALAVTIVATLGALAGPLVRAGQIPSAALFRS